jgi:3-hydroxyacyl-CoA dehydrogenase
VVSSNTSGIPIHSLAQGFSDDFRKHFLGTHFFNPPRYLKLLEIIPTPDTDPDLTRFLIRFGEDQLGKGVVLCKDTPNFIGNRIATQGICVLLKAMMDEGLTVEEVDLLTGPVLGRPKSATFRTFDVVGVDTFVLVIRNLHDLLPDSTEREIFTVPPFVQTMLQNRWLGDKTGQGFYKKIRTAGGSEIHYLDYQTMEYRPAQHPRFAALDRIKKLPSLEKQLRELVFGSDRAGKFLWTVLSSSLSYAASKIPEISDDIVSVDRAMKWGFLYKLGPFETWDALGVEAVRARLQEEGRPTPALVESLLASGKK